MPNNCPRCGRIMTGDGISVIELLIAHYAEGCMAFPSGPDRKARAEREGRAEGLQLIGGPPVQENHPLASEMEGFVDGANQGR